MKCRELLFLFLNVDIRFSKINVWKHVVNCCVRTYGIFRRPWNARRRKPCFASDSVPVGMTLLLAAPISASRSRCKLHLWQKSWASPLFCKRSRNPLVTAEMAVVKATSLLRLGNSCSYKRPPYCSYRRTEPVFLVVLSCARFPSAVDEMVYSWNCISVWNAV